MESIAVWCYTVCAGIVFCGIVMILAPSQRYQKIMQMVLGLFILVCIFSWGHISFGSIHIDTQEAEQARNETARKTTNYFLGRVRDQSEERIRKTVREYIRQYGINPDICKIYIETEETIEGESEMFVELRLPEVLREYQQVIHEALTYELGLDVRIEYQP